MAILQISRITNRKGLADDLPQPLAGAELGWCTDTRQLFIGNGTLAEGAPVVDNTEILTEFSDIFAIATTYTYKGLAGGYTVQTGASLGSPVYQSLQSRLDSYCVATDFGIVGDGVTDNTTAINRALYQLYCIDSANPSVRRSLFFPAGRYVISNTINIPTYATLYGEGINNSVIDLIISAWDINNAYAAGVTVEDSGTYYTSDSAVPIGVDIDDTTYWTEVADPQYIWRTADSRQQTNTNIGLGGATPPTGIEIVNMKFSNSTITDGVLIQDAVQMALTNVAFEGPLTQTDITDGVGADTLPQIAAVRWASTESLVCKDIVFSGCSFHGYAYGTKTAQQIKAVTIANGSFDTLFQGVCLGDSVVVNGGATGVKLLSNDFDNIFSCGVVFQNVSLNSTGYNVFYDVANDFNGTDYPATYVIDIDGDDNVCVGDMFQRTAAIVDQYPALPRINYHNRPNITTVNGYTTNFGTYSRFSGVQATMTNDTTDLLFTTPVDATVVRAFKMDYTIVRGTGTRTGTLTVVAGTDGSGTGLANNDDYYENSAIGVTFAVGESASAINIQYTVSDTGTDAVINYSITKLA